MMKIAILTRPDNKSPKNLALSLASTLSSEGISNEILFDTGFLTRMIPLSKPLRWKANFHYRIRQKLKFFLKDTLVLKKLKTFDAIIICDCIPNAMWYNVFPVELIKRKLNKPIGLYEVFFLDSAPHFIEKLKEEYPDFINAYDFELAISDVSYTKILRKSNQFQIGLNLKGQGLKVTPKQEFIALIDFEWDGEKKYIIEQKKVLERLGIKYIELKGRYTFDEIRAEYAKCSLFFLQHFESFGLPIAETLSYGAQIFTANSGWPMAFRMNKDPQVYGEGKLGNCFTVYNSEVDLEQKLIDFRNNYHLTQTPIDIFDDFQRNYSDFYLGNKRELGKMVSYISKGIIK